MYLLVNSGNSYLTIETLNKAFKLIINASERSNDVVLVSSVLTLKMFHTLFSVSIVKFGQELNG